MRRLAFVLLLSLSTVVANAATSITILNKDKAGTGFNDPTPANPVGGNTGTTLGEQRLIAFRYAASVWGSIIDSPVPIVISATFAPIIRTGQPCTATSGILGAAGPTTFAANFEGAPQRDVWYPIALANRFAGQDLNGEDAEIQAQFNSLVDDPNCLGSTSWYYGLDGNHGSNIDLVVVLLHEFAHGLGFIGGTDLETGELLQGKPSAFELHTFDASSGLRWNQMSDQQRLTSVTNVGRVAWDGLSTRQFSATTMSEFAGVTVVSPSALSAMYDVSTAEFGPSIRSTGISGKVVEAIDPSNTDGPATSDGCSAFTNAPDVRGNIALVDRGTCPFLTKAQNAQAAGAVALIVVDRASSCDSITMSGTDASLTIPVVMIRSTDGTAIRNALADGVFVLVGRNPAALAGQVAGGYMRLYAPCTVSPGSSIYHWDTVSDPNLLMEPNVNSDLGHGVDITINQLMDIGWSIAPSAGPHPGRRTLKRGR